jgi:ABC-2 type transport system ATP-binding protein
MRRNDEMTQTTAVAVSGLRKTYAGGVEAVRGVTFDVGAGEVFGLLGPNGAGKSTTIGMLTTTITPTSGTARLAGFDVAEQPIEARRVSAVVFQEPVVDAMLTGRRNLETHARLWGVEATSIRSGIDDLATQFGLAGLVDRLVGTYSGGERRRLEIARALLSQPTVLFLDEPTVGLDTRIRHELMDVIAGLRADDGMSVVLTTHYLDEAERLCDRVAIMHQGLVVAMDTPARLLATLGRELVEVRFAGDGSRGLAALRRRGVAGDDAFAVGATVTVPLHEASASTIVTAIAEEALATESVTSRTPTLDDVYLKLTGDRLAA